MRDDTRKATRRGRELGLSRASILAMGEEAPTTTLDPGSAAADVPRACVSWPTSEWLALSPDRRLFLFSIVDALIAAGDGDATEAWIDALTAGELAVLDPAKRRALWDGSRGQALLALDGERCSAGAWGDDPSFPGADGAKPVGSHGRTVLASREKHPSPCPGSRRSASRWRRAPRAPARSGGPPRSSRVGMVIEF
ncbi:MAG: hypothetical protein Q8P18_16835 [Pseudomonadota bacterium]|nr:hypothetical protein [Pseudomonadota bacterium]